MLVRGAKDENLCKPVNTFVPIPTARSFSRYTDISMSSGSSSRNKLLSMLDRQGGIVNPKHVKDLSSSGFDSMVLFKASSRGQTKRSASSSGAAAVASSSHHQHPEEESSADVVVVRQSSVAAPAGHTVTSGGGQPAVSRTTKKKTVTVVVQEPPSSKRKLSDDVSEDLLASKELWKTIQPIVGIALRPANLDGSVMPTVSQLLAYGRIKAYFRRGMRKTPQTSPYLQLRILHTIAVRETGVFERDCSLALVAAALWELNLCDKNSWRLKTRPETMFVCAEFYSDETRFRLAPVGICMDATVPVRFRHRLVAAASTICHALRDEGKLLTYSARGFDALLLPVYKYYLKLIRGGQSATPTVTAEQWCAHHFSDDMLEDANAAGPMDNVCLNDMPCDAESGVEVYTWMPVMAYYLAHMEKQVCTPFIVVTDLVSAEFANVSSWGDVCIPSVLLDDE